MPPRHYIFNHIAKTGGTSLLAVCGQNLEPAEISPHLAAIGRDCPGYPAGASALMAPTRHNLAAFDFVGICEELERSVRLLGHEKRTSSEAWFSGIQRQIMGILRDRSHLDLAVCEYSPDPGIRARRGSAWNSITKWVAIAARSSWWSAIAARHLFGDGRPNLAVGAGLAIARVSLHRG